MSPEELRSVVAFQRVVFRFSQWIVLFYCTALLVYVIFDDISIPRNWFAFAYATGIAGLCSIGLWVLHRPKQLKPWSFILASIGLMAGESMLAAIALWVENPSDSWLYSGVFTALLGIVGACIFFSSLLWTPPKQGGSSGSKKAQPTKHSQKRPAKKRTHYNLPPALTNPPPSGGKGKR